MKLTSRIDGAELATRALALLDPAVQEHVAEVVQSDAEAAVEAAKARVPKRSGELAGTIRKTSSKDGLVAWVQAGYGTLRRRSRSGAAKGDKPKKKAAENEEPGVYAMVIEFGDARRNRPAEPYMIPAVESIRAQHQINLEDALQAAVESVGGHAT